MYLPLHHFAGTNIDGTRVAQPVVPDRIELHPTAEARAAFDAAAEWRLAFAALPAGMRLFDLRVGKSIDEEAVPMGTLVIESPFVASRYGDDRLFFQHDVGPTAQTTKS